LSKFIHNIFVRIIQHAPTHSNTLQSIVLYYVYYRMERDGANRNMLGHDANNLMISNTDRPIIYKM